jgi:tRNA dimethylallyltransferase
LEQKILINGIDALHADLIKLDPEAGQNIDPHDSQRIIRAIEIIISTKHELE